MRHIHKDEDSKGYRLHKKAMGVLAIGLVLISMMLPYITLRPIIAYASNTSDAAANMQVNAGGDEKVTAEVINDWYASTTRKDGRLAGKGDEIVKVADKYGINRAYFVALMDAETTSGKNACFGNDYNFGCMRGYEGSSVEEGLDDLGALIAEYIAGSKNTTKIKNPTMQQFINVYAPSIENDHASRFEHHGAVYDALGVDADEMQKTGKLKNGQDSTSPDYNGEDETRSLASSCPINCDLVPQQRVSDNGTGASTGNVKYLPKGELWKNPGKLTDTDIGYTSDQSTKENLEKYLDVVLPGEDNKELAKIFFEAGDDSGLDPRFLIGFWSVNTVNGTSEAWEKSYNAFGWTTGGDFSTEKEGIIEGAKLISVNYYNEGQTTLNKMVSDNSGHIVSADEDWAKAVASIMALSEDAITESTGKIPAEVETLEESEWISEQCYGNGETGLTITDGTYTEQVISFLTNEGFTNESISGILGNMQKESGVSPTRLQGHSMEASEKMTDEERTKRLANNTNGAYAAGIVQWEAPRFKTVRAKASELGVSPFTMEPQMLVLVQELKSMNSGSYGSGTLYDLYKTNTDIYTATASFAQLFERCRACKPGTGEFEQRTGMSKEYYATYF